ncbi:protein-disulfide reductase DsbD family protein [Rhodobacter sp. KR11]|jgi:DsbC/DsbD-like thiol-disulfide interchange protein|uniref:protein-disulfide reductase DsbD domain-containing protein n=1 Tax=Rhodobacter sp. KR11 TaxID=2974588 RepID=UPI0022236DB0|nr:protein-disulfide reductase DsbD domain-containing protein [Rhodobacter sp. KR11]MCW1917262.1 protein-disulfide reductase DsbD family protein [Rhodobacter sp. KR11]
MLRYAIILLATPAMATSQDEVLSARLLPGWQQADGSHMVALELTLAPGWKTYWRAPGDVGLPPSFDWQGSQNLDAARFHWPAPEVIASGDTVTLGYHDRLILPVTLTTQGAGPLRVDLSMDLGICKDICMPAHLEFHAVLEGAGAPDAAIAAALAAVPAQGQAALTCAVEPIADGLRLTARIPMTGAEPYVIFETHDPKVWVSAAQTRVEDGALVSSADLVPPTGAPFALDRSGVTVTVLGAGAPVEIKGCPAG